jgi:hypothetical protein
MARFPGVGTGSILLDGLAVEVKRNPVADLAETPSSMSGNEG